MASALDILSQLAQYAAPLGTNGTSGSCDMIHPGFVAGSCAMAFGFSKQFKVAAASSNRSAQRDWLGVAQLPGSTQVGMGGGSWTTFRMSTCSGQ